jgi:hypothetical protein
MGRRSGVLFSQDRPDLLGSAHRSATPHMVSDRSVLSPLAESLLHMDYKAFPVDAGDCTME